MADSSKATAADGPRAVDGPRLAAAVILVRERPETGELEVYLQRRHARASFMSSAFVFPGGAADPTDRDLRVTAVRELFEESGVLLSRTPVAADTRAAWQTLLQAGTATMGALVARSGANPDPDAPDAFYVLDTLHYFAHWITPSAERKRFSAVFYLAALPAGETAAFDNQEMVDDLWVTPDEALANAGELRLPPPQLRTFLDLREPARAGMAALLAAAAFRAAQPYPVLPRVAMPVAGEPPRVTLLLPWDPEYQSRGTGEGLVIPAYHPLAVGPSRFVLEGASWKHIDAPSSPSAA
jgi:8-oxo-dGTP pyrophosphatase MutT (NUDIX family)